MVIWLIGKSGAGKSEIGIILYEMIHNTPNDEVELVDVLKSLRKLCFPPSFHSEFKENILIKKMLSHQAEDRPTIAIILNELEQLGGDESHGKLLLWNTAY